MRCAMYVVRNPCLLSCKMHNARPLQKPTARPSFSFLLLLNRYSNDVDSGFSAEYDAVPLISVCFLFPFPFDISNRKKRHIASRFLFRYFVCSFVRFVSSLSRPLRPQPPLELQCSLPCSHCNSLFPSFCRSAAQTIPKSNQKRQKRRTKVIVCRDQVRLPLRACLHATVALHPNIFSSNSLITRNSRSHVLDP